MTENKNSNPEIGNTSSKTAPKKSKAYDLEERTFAFAKKVRGFVRKLPRTMSNIEDGKQPLKSSGSVGANFIEASDPLSAKDFMLRIKICRKEAKESRYWLRLIDTGGKQELEGERIELQEEAEELMKIFGSIVRKNQKDIDNLG